MLQICHLITVSVRLTDCIFVNFCNVKNGFYSFILVFSGLCLEITSISVNEASVYFFSLLFIFIFYFSGAVINLKILI